MQQVSILVCCPPHRQINIDSLEAGRLNRFSEMSVAELRIGRQCPSTLLRYSISPADQIVSSANMICEKTKSKQARLVRWCWQIILNSQLSLLNSWQEDAYQAGCSLQKN
jgi:hypothetical protein